MAAAAEATATANAGGTAPTLDPETIQLALANTDRTEPAVPFAQARGFLTLPSSGVTVIDYGAGDGFGGISKGLSIVTRAEAQVVAPADGWVLYKGDYLNYGQIVILNAGQDYTILLAGLATVDRRYRPVRPDGRTRGHHGITDNWPDGRHQCWRLPADALY